MLFSNLNIPLKAKLESAISNVDSGIGENSIESHSLMQSSSSLDNSDSKLSSGSCGSNKQQKRKIHNEYPDDNSLYPNESDSSSVSNGSSTGEKSAENCLDKRQTKAGDESEKTVVATSHKCDEAISIATKEVKSKASSESDSSDDYQGPPCKNAAPTSFCKFARCNKPGCSSNNRPSEPEVNRENLLYQRIMNLPLSDVVKRFLLYNRDF